MHASTACTCLSWFRQRKIYAWSEILNVLDVPTSLIGYATAIQELYIYICICTYMLTIPSQHHLPSPYNINHLCNINPLSHISRPDPWRSFSTRTPCLCSTLITFLMSIRQSLLLYANRWRVKSFWKSVHLCSVQKGVTTSVHARIGVSLSGSIWWAWCDHRCMVPICSGLHWAVATVV